MSVKRTSEAAFQSAEDYIIGDFNHFFLLNTRDCGYARMEVLGCAVVCARNCGYARMGRSRKRSISKSRLTGGQEIWSASHGNKAGEGENNIKYANSYPMNWKVKNWFVQYSAIFLCIYCSYMYIISVFIVTNWCVMLIVLYVSVINTKAYATLVTEHNFSGYVLFNLFLLYFL